MIVASLGPITAYRMHTPRWAGTPTSGAGAGAHGGRANRPGTDALYLALDIETAVLEYQQASPLMPPGTLVSYTVELTKAVDFSNGYQPLTWEPLWEDFYCDWRELWFNQRVEPPSWVLGAWAAEGGDSERWPQRGQFLPDLKPHSPAMGRKDGEKWTAAVALQPPILLPPRLLADQALGQGAKGICFRSRLTGGMNVVVYTRQLALSAVPGTSGRDHLQAHDPGGALPKNQDSWR